MPLVMRVPGTRAILCANVAEHVGVTVQVKVVSRDGGADAHERRRYVARARSGATRAAPRPQERAPHCACGFFLSCT